MESNTKRKVVLGVAVGLLLAGGGGAFAASKLMTPQQQAQAVINDAANRLGVQPSQLTDALKKALEDRVDAAVSSGELTQAQGDAMKKQIESGTLPLFFQGPVGGPGVGGFGFGFTHGGVVGGDLAAAAKAIGITEAQLQTQLQNGKTLAQIAKDNGKTADDVVNALVADAQTKLDAAVKAGKLTQDQADAILKNMKSRITDQVNGTAPGPGFGPRGFGGPGLGFDHGAGGADLDAAAKAIGITEAQLETQLQNGKTLAQIAKDNGKTADDVVNALVADAQTKLNAAVKAGKLTQSQADSILNAVKSHLTDLVNGKTPGPWAAPNGFRSFRGFRGRPEGFNGPSGFSGPSGGAFGGQQPSTGVPQGNTA